MSESLTSRQKQAQEMRDRIRNVALALFNKRGFDEVSMASIAREAGCSVGNIYNYFKSKEELAAAITENVDAAYLEIEKEYAADTEGTALGHLLDFVGRTLRTSIEDPILYPSFIYATKNPQSGLLDIKPERVYFRMLKDLVMQCQKEGSLSRDIDPDEMVRRLVVIHRGLLIEHRLEKDDAFDFESEGRDIVSAMIRGING